MQNIMSATSPSPTRGQAVLDTITKEILVEFLTRVAPAYPDLTFNAYTGSVAVVDEVGALIGEVSTSHRYTQLCTETVLVLYSGKAPHPIKTKSVTKAVKDFAKYFSAPTPHDLVNTARKRATARLGNAKIKASLAVRAVLGDAFLSLCDTGGLDSAVHALAAWIPADATEKINDCVVEFESAKEVDGLLGEFTVIVAGAGRYIIAYPNGTMDTVAEVPPEFRKAVGMLKLASPMQYVPNMGIKAEDGYTFFCLPDKPV